MPQIFHISVGAPVADVGFGSDEAAAMWEETITDQILAVQDAKKFWEENQQQMGRKPGVNSGHGYIEAMIPPKLWRALERRDPEFFTDPKKWDKLMREHPELRVNMPLTPRVSFA